jgi:hypothetical protein
LKSCHHIFWVPLLRTARASFWPLDCHRVSLLFAPVCPRFVPGVSQRAHLSLSVRSGVRACLRACVRACACVYLCRPVSMSVSVSVRVHTYAWVCQRVCVSVFVCVCGGFACVSICLSVCLYLCLCLCLLLCVCVSVCLCVCVFVCDCTSCLGWAGDPCQYRRRCLGQPFASQRGPEAGAERLDCGNWRRGFQLRSGARIRGHFLAHVCRDSDGLWVCRGPDPGPKTSSSSGAQFAGPTAREPGKASCEREGVWLGCLPGFSLSEFLFRHLSAFFRRDGRRGES